MKTSIIVRARKVLSPTGLYYTSTIRTEADPGDLPGKFYGAGAEALGISGRAIEKNDKCFSNLLQGVNPNDDSRLRPQNAFATRTYRTKDGRDRIAKPVYGYDIVICLDKGSSILYAAALVACDPTVSSSLYSLLCQAVAKVRAYAEEKLSVGRTGKAGETLEQVKLIFAQFFHVCSRDGSPSLHIHLVLLNTAIRANGKGVAVDAKNLFRKGAPFLFEAGAICGETIRRGLTQLGIRTHNVPLKRGMTFALTDVPRELVEALSTRRREALRTLPAEPTHKEIDQAILKTRPEKKRHHLGSLYSAWKKSFMAHHFDYRQVIDRTRMELEQRPRDRLVRNGYYSDPVFRASQAHTRDERVQERSRNVERER